MKFKRLAVPVRVCAAGQGIRPFDGGRRGGYHRHGREKAGKRAPRLQGAWRPGRNRPPKKTGGRDFPAWEWAGEFPRAAKERGWSVGCKAWASQAALLFPAAL